MSSSSCSQFTLSLSLFQAPLSSAASVCTSHLHPFSVFQSLCYYCHALLPCQHLLQQWMLRNMCYRKTKCPRNMENGNHSEIIVRMHTSCPPRCSACGSQGSAACRQRQTLERTRLWIELPGRHRWCHLMAEPSRACAEKEYCASHALPRHLSLELPEGDGVP